MADTTNTDVKDLLGELDGLSASISDARSNVEELQNRLSVFEDSICKLED